MPTPDFITQAYLAVWTCVDNWPATAGKLKQSYRYQNDDMSALLDIDPAYSDLPALSIFPGAASSQYWVTETVKFKYVLDFKLWTAHWAIPEANQLFLDLMDALFQYKDADHPNGVIKNTTNYYPNGTVGGFAQTMVKLGKNQNVFAVRTDWSIMLPMNFNFFR